MESKKGIYERFIKRPQDFFLALIALILMSPIILIVTILVKVKFGNPVIFKQERPGLNEKIFTLYKFRTMTDKKDSNGILLSDEMRMTKFGKLLRSTSMDELPELINILKGDMSFVGPRPLLVEYLPLYDEEQQHRHDVRPGLTGLAQIYGRNTIKWEERFKIDIEYIEGITFFRDWVIIIRTIGRVIRRSGISSDTCTTMELFTNVKRP